MSTLVHYWHYLLLAVILLLFLTIVVWYSIYFWYSSYFKKLPKLGSITPLLGIAKVALNPPVLYHAFLEHFARNEKTAFTMIGPTPIIITVDPKFIEMLCTSKRVQKSKWVYPLANNFLGRGLIISEGEHWKMQRKLLTPAFHYNVLQRNVAVFDEHSDRIVERLAGELNGSSIDVSKYCFEYGMCVIYENTIGISYNHIKAEMQSYIAGVKEIMHIIFRRLVNPVRLCDMTYRLTEDARTENKIIKKIHGLIDRAIELKSQSSKTKNMGDNNNEMPLLLDILLKNDEFYSRELLRNEVNTIVYAGTDTSSTTLSFTTYMLSKLPEIQEKAFQEVYAIHQDLSGRAITINDVSKMQYLHNVILETLRLCGTAPYIVKEFIEPTVYNGVTYPKGIPIVVAIFALHRDSRHYDNPNEFIPERHLPENAKSMEPYSFIPFSGGPRNCIGQRYSLLAMKIFMYKLLLNFEILPDKDHEIIYSPEIIMVSKNGFKVHLKPRIL